MLLGEFALESRLFEGHDGLHTDASTEPPRRPERHWETHLAQDICVFLSDDDSRHHRQRATLPELETRLCESENESDSVTAKEHIEAKARETHNGLGIVNPELLGALNSNLACASRLSRLCATKEERDVLGRWTAPSGSMVGTKRSMLPKLFFGTLPCGQKGRT